MKTKVLGRPRHEKPSGRDKDIIKLYKQGYGFAQLGRRYALTRQRIHQITRRWQ